MCADLVLSFFEKMLISRLMDILKILRYIIIWIFSKVFEKTCAVTQGSVKTHFVYFEKCYKNVSTDLETQTTQLSKV